ncbi:hypothetical protein E2C01_083901 [Portunus trituberculatus]|uniref:Uncharacterized protein n=1 Tax=Portunus trituberculatus TaxID=210409 RepID=A0A5B7J994_PORTR|nr:hypothetical protein [Portunus trituberculatus]
MKSSRRLVGTSAPTARRQRRRKPHRCRNHRLHLSTYLGLFSAAGSDGYWSQVPAAAAVSDALQRLVSGRPSEALTQPLLPLTYCGPGSAKPSARAKRRPHSNKACNEDCNNTAAGHGVSAPPASQHHAALNH